jgi:hypothetical protein
MPELETSEPYLLPALFQGGFGPIKTNFDYLEWCIRKLPRSSKCYVPGFKRIIELALHASLSWSTSPSPYEERVFQKF